jgi:hypothetical protein
MRKRYAIPAIAVLLLAATSAIALASGHTGRDAQNATAAAPVKQAERAVEAAPAVRFATITVTIDPKGVPLAAYQFELTAGHAFTVVGLDHAGHPAFADPPRYDRAAAADGTDRLIVADYSTRPAGELIAKPQAAAVIHAAFWVGDDTDPEALADRIAVTLTAAADPAGNRIDADIAYDLHLAERPGQE